MTRTDPHVVVHHDYQGLVADSQRADRLTLVSLATRPGATRFFTVLEWDCFPPKTARNAEFQLNLLRWPLDESLVWVVAIVPLVAMPDARRIASETGMRFADGVPTFIRRGHAERFPCDHGRVWTIENDLGSPIYVPNGAEFVAAEEKRWLRAFFASKGIDPYQ
jgi:hypothetical protein